MSICITTGFKDIGRGDWDSFKRSPDTYFKGFKKLSSTCPYPLVAYVDGKYVDLVKSDRVGVKVLPIDDMDLLINTHNEKDWEVMNSPEYGVLMKRCNHDKSHPERSKKGYNMINASKAGMIVNTKKICPGFEWYAWQDFGNVNLDGGLPVPLDFSKLSKDKITVHGKYYDPRKGLRIDPVGLARSGGAPYLCGAQIIVPSKMVEQLDHWVRQAVDYYHSINLTDDDQSIMAVIMNNRPKAFEWVGLGDSWYDLWKHYRVK